MKKILLLIALALTAQTIKAQADAFITTWVTTTGFETLTLSAQADAPNYTINWGDGFTNTYTATQVPTHTYFNSGEHTVSFTGTFPHLTFSGQTKLKAVQQWGTQKWTSMANMFESCATFNSFPSQAPDLSLCTSMSYIFFGATDFNQPIGSWDVSKVTNMSGMLLLASSFNQPLGSWDMSQVTDMSYMFYYASAFNQPIGSWNVSKVTNMSYMFYYASAFNQPIESWNVSKVTYMGGMFRNVKLSTVNYDNLLIGWAMQGANGGLIQRNVSFSGGYSNYSNALGARDYLINTYGWVISDGGASRSILNNDITSQIGTQTWAAKNLDVSTYSDGTVIPQVTDPTQWAGLTTGAWCYSYNDPSYGKLYNWFAVAGINDNDETTPNKSLAPAGYHIPSVGEWDTLTKKVNLKTSDFAGLPGFYRGSIGGFDNLGGWWCSDGGFSNAYNIFMDANSGRISFSFQSPKQGLSVRCVRDTGILPILNSFSTTVTNITANTATIGGQVTSDGGNIETTRGVVWSASSIPTIDLSTKTIDGSGIGTFTSAITGLNANTTYYIRAYATNQIGTAYGTEVSFTTLGPPKQVTIGSQTWTDKNLDVATYSDGTVIPQVTDPTAWANLTTGAWCYYNNDSANGTTYGKLYNWYAVAGIHDNDPNTPNKKLAPTGYHIPSDAEWTTLITYLGGDEIAGGKMKSTGTIQAGNGLWESPNETATNLSGFTGLPGGLLNKFGGVFGGIGTSGIWWTSSPNAFGSIYATYCRITSQNGTIEKGPDSKENGFSVRYIKDNDNTLSNATFGANSFKIYPNPVKNTITLDFGNSSNDINNPYTVIDTLGKVILKGKLNEGDNSINVEQLSKGIYYLKVSDKNASKFIKE